MEFQNSKFKILSAPELENSKFKISLSGVVEFQNSKFQNLSFSSGAQAPAFQISKFKIQNLTLRSGGISKFKIQNLTLRSGGISKSSSSGVEIQNSKSHSSGAEIQNSKSCERILKSSKSCRRILQRISTPGPTIKNLKTQLSNTSRLNSQKLREGTQKS